MMRDVIRLRAAHGPHYSSAPASRGAADHCDPGLADPPLILRDPPMNTRILPLILITAAGISADVSTDVSCPYLLIAPTIDGDLADWKVGATLTMSEPAVDDLQPKQAILGWDDTGIYLGLAMQDRTLLNLGKGDRIAKGDCADLRLVMPDGRLIRLLVSPVTDGGGPAMHLSSRSEVKGPLTELASADTPNTGAPEADAKSVAWAVKSDAAGWTVEALVPWALVGFTPVAGASFPFVVVGWDLDQPDDWKVWHNRTESANQKKQETWPQLLMTK